MPCGSVRRERGRSRKSDAGNSIDGSAGSKVTLETLVAGPLDRK